MYRGTYLYFTVLRRFMPFCAVLSRLMPVLGLFCRFWHRFYSFVTALSTAFGTAFEKKVEESPRSLQDKEKEKKPVYSFPFPYPEAALRPCAVLLLFYRAVLLLLRAVILLLVLPRTALVTPRTALVTPRTALVTPCGISLIVSVRH